MFTTCTHATCTHDDHVAMYHTLLYKQKPHAKQKVVAADHKTQYKCIIKHLHWAGWALQRQSQIYLHTQQYHYIHTCSGSHKQWDTTIC